MCRSECVSTNPTPPPPQAPHPRGMALCSLPLDPESMARDPSSGHHFPSECVGERFGTLCWDATGVAQRGCLERHPPFSINSHFLDHLVILFPFFCVWAMRQSVWPLLHDGPPRPFSSTSLPVFFLQPDRGVRHAASPPGCAVPRPPPSRGGAAQRSTPRPIFPHGWVTPPYLNHPLLQFGFQPVRPTGVA